jgi:hypothetical protein
MLQSKKIYIIGDKNILSIYCHGRKWENSPTIVIKSAQLARFPCVCRGYNAHSPLRMIQVSKECLDENYTGEKEDLSSQHKYQVYNMTILFKRKTSTYCSTHFPDPLRKCPVGIKWLSLKTAGCLGWWWWYFKFMFKIFSFCHRTPTISHKFLWTLNSLHTDISHHELPTTLNSFT